MKPTKVIFFGTSDRSLPVIEALKSNFNLSLCITKKDSVFGRKQILKETEVKKWAIQNNINYLEISSLKNADLECVLNEIEKINPKIGIVADFSYIIPKAVIDAFSGNIINIHFSLLPKYRGASPVQFSILNGDKMAGITYYILDEKMDEGKILSQIEYKLDTKYTSGELYDILFKIAGEKLPDIIQKYLSRESKPTSQDHMLATYTNSKTNPKHTFIYKEDALIDWSESAEKIERCVRAFHPWPIAWTYLGNLENSKILAQNIILKDNADKTLKVKIFNADLIRDKLTIGKLQVEGKNKVSWEEFKNGYVKEAISQ
jgi:methionyl-tRNA formyltransferase